MSFESKYLIRWGIPGWVFLLFVIWLYKVHHSEVFVELNDPVKLLSFVIAIASIGVPIGYILHQVYFGVFWTFRVKKGLKAITNYIENYEREFPNQEDDIKEYYHLEYLWQDKLSMLPEERRTYIAERYRHLLATTHSLGVLFTSLVGSFIVYLFIGKQLTWSAPNIVYGLLQIFIAWFVSINYNYYSAKTAAFQGKFLNDFINGKDTITTTDESLETEQH